MAISKAEWSAAARYPSLAHTAAHAHCRLQLHPSPHSCVPILAPSNRTSRLSIWPAICHRPLRAKTDLNQISGNENGVCFKQKTLDCWEKRVVMADYCFLGRWLTGGCSEIESHLVAGFKTLIFGENLICSNSHSNQLHGVFCSCIAGRFTLVLRPSVYRRPWGNSLGDQPQSNPEKAMHMLLWTGKTGTQDMSGDSTEWEIVGMNHGIRVLLLLRSERRWKLKSYFGHVIVIMV